MSQGTVKRGHIVPEMYLAAWAKRKQVGVRLDDGRNVGMPTRKAGTRSRYYQRTRPDGTKIDDIEESFAKSESATAPILREIKERWPLTHDPRSVLAEFIALQYVRSPRWREWYGDRSKDAVAEWIREGSVEPQNQDDAEAFLLSDHRRALRMYSLLPKIASAFGSMHWMLIEFREPVLMTCDHPVVAWPLGTRSMDARPFEHDTGIFEMLEMRFPVSPTILLLGVWIDRRISEERIIRGARQHASNANALTLANAERQSYFVLETSPPIADRRLVPLSPNFFAGYDERAARACTLRRQVQEQVNALISQESDAPEDRGITLYNVTEPASSNASE
jgi:hypothetical protein